MGPLTWATACDDHVHCPELGPPCQVIDVLRHLRPRSLQCQGRIGAADNQGALAVATDNSGNIILSGENFDWGENNGDNNGYTWTARVQNDTTSTLALAAVAFAKLTGARVAEARLSTS